MTIDNSHHLSIYTIQIDITFFQSQPTIYSCKFHSSIIMVFQLHIGVLAFPFGTHAPPLLALVRRLADSAPRAVFSFLNSADSNATLFKKSDSYDNIQAYDVWDGTPQGQAFTGTHFEAVGLFLKASPGNFEKVIEEAEQKAGLRISCLITDAFLWFACDLADQRGLPWLAFWTAASCSLSSHVYTDQILEAGTEKREQNLSFIPGLEMATLTDLPPEVFLDKSPSPLAITINKMVEKLPKSTAVVLNSFEEIDPIITEDLKSKFKHFLNVGPSILASSPQPTPGDNTGCLSWLENQTRPRSVVYISFGTVITPPENELTALAEALEICKFPFLWSLKDCAVKSLPDGFLDRTKELGKIVPWAPQQQVLAHRNVGVFVTHCGWNSILESISSSVPLICRPFFGDQKLNSRKVQDSWGIGVRVEGGVFTKNGTVESLKKLMATETGIKIMDNVSLLREKAAAAVKPDGSSSSNFKKLLEILGAAETS